MADTLTPNIKITNQTEGGNSNTWGTIADANFEQIDNKFGDVTSISTTGGSTTLSDSQEIVNAIVVSGALVSNATVVFSGRGGSWVVRNDTTGGYSVTCKVSGQTGVSIEQGGAALVFCDGTDIRYGNPPSATTAEVTVASATTTDILGAASEFVAVSGTATITSFGTGANKKRFVRATGAFKITHNASSLICPGGYDITATAGDTFLVVSDASSNCRIHAYQRSAFAPPTTLVGEVKDYAGSTAPTGWLMCYGQAVSRTTYAALFNVISTAFGAGDSVTTFNLPDARGRVIAGKDNMGGTSANRLTGLSGGLDGDTLGAVGGEEAHTLSTTEMPGHTHTGTTDGAGSHFHYVVSAGGGTEGTLTASNSVDNSRDFGGGSLFDYSLAGDTNTATIGKSSTESNHTHTFTTASTGGGGAHNNLPPTIILNKIIFAGV